MGCLRLSSVCQQIPYHNNVSALTIKLLCKNQNIENYEKYNYLFKQILL